MKYYKPMSKAYFSPWLPVIYGLMQNKYGFGEAPWA